MGQPDGVIRTPCQRCGCAKDGAGEYCVHCWAAVYVDCPSCTVRSSSGGRRVRHDSRTHQPIVCRQCGGARYVRRDGLRGG